MNWFAEVRTALHELKAFCLMLTTLYCRAFEKVELLLQCEFRNFGGEFQKSWCKNLRRKVYQGRTVKMYVSCFSHKFNLSLGI